MPMPTMSNTAPIRNSSRVPVSMGTMVALSKKTIAVIGRTLASDSLVFSFNCSFITNGQTSFSHSV